MQRKCKKILSFVFVFVMVVSLFEPFEVKRASAAVTLKSSVIQNYVLSKVNQYYPSGYCLKFVEECYQNLGAVRPYNCCAYKSGSNYICSQDRSNIPIGATVYFGNCGGGPCKQCGSQYYGHVGIYVGDGYFVHATGGKVQKSTISSWANKYRGYGYCGNFSLNQDISSGGGQAPDAGFSTDYAGNYKVNTSTYPLSMRSGPSTNYSIVTTIPRNSTVYVEKANGSWAYVSYNGYKGYCSMEYLTKADSTEKLPATNLHAWFSMSPMGDGVNNIRLNDTIYLCYRLETMDGKLLDSSIGNYSVKETLYFPDGSSFPYSYGKSNNNWIRSNFNQWGTYRGVVEISGDYTGTVEVSYTIAKPKEIFLDTWFSSGKMGSSVSYLEKGKSYYLCYSITCDNNGYFNKYANVDYNVTQEVYDPDGKKVYGYTYDKSDNNWIKFTATKSGNYKGIATVRGAFTGRDTETCICKDTTVVQEPKLQSISVTKLPQKTIYTLGEKLDTSGMVVTAQYSNGKSKNISNYKVSGTTNKAGQNSVVISYTENGITKITSFYITVKEKELPKEVLTVTYDPKGGAMSTTTQTGTKGSYITILTEQPIKNIKVTFDANGGNTASESMMLPMKFSAWVESSGEYSNRYFGGEKYLLEKNITLSALYDDAVITSLPSVQRDGYQFDGWYNGNNVKAYVGMNLNIDEKFVAHWTKEPEETLINGLNPIPNEPEDNVNREEDSNEDLNKGLNDDQNDMSTNGEVPDPDYDVEEETEEPIAVGDEITTNDAIYTVIKLGKTPCVQYSELFDDEAKSVVIPSTITQDGVTYRVTSVAGKAFYKHAAIQKVSIGKNVTKIGSQAFYGCKSLKRIVIYSEQLKSGSIGSKAFTKVVKNVKVYVPSTKYKSYKKLLKKAGIGSKAKIYKLK